MNIPIITSEDISRVSYAIAVEKLIPDDQLIAFRYKVTISFRALLKYKLWKFALYSDLDWSKMALGERICLNLAYILVFSEQLNKSFLSAILPVTQLLDNELRHGVIEHLFGK